MHLLFPLLALTATTTTAAVLPPQSPLTPLNPSTSTSSHEDSLCPLPPRINLPASQHLHPALTFLHDPSYRDRQIERLSRAVRIPTTVTDFMTDPYDPGFEVFGRFHDVLREMFPLVHQKTTLESPNRLSLLYTLTGSNPSLKPALYMAHQDVVPINSAADWTHPPFSGYYDPDTDFLWGRGSSDCKNVLIGLLSVLEDLLAQDWTPQRTVIFSFGFDEESHGFLGAGSLSRFLEERYGSDGDGVEFILDEGGMGLQALGGEGENGNGGGTVYALPGVGEKGALDLVISLNVTGGHSSIPPPHTGIGIVSEIIYNLERTDLFTPLLGDDHPLRKVLECQLAHSPDHVEPWLSQALASDDQVSAAEDVGESRGPAVKHVLRTSQAVDMIGGGVKSNALPEKVSAVVNYRVGLHETPEEVIERAVGIIAPIAEEYGLGFSYPGSTEEEKGEVNHIDIRPLSEPLQPAPVSPTSLEDLVWRRFAGVTRGVFEDVFNKTVVVVGDVMTGNTDTRFYWNLSRNIYRWSPTFQGDALNIHTVDERMKMEGHLQGMMVYYDLMRAFDEGSG